MRAQPMVRRRAASRGVALLAVAVFAVLPSASAAADETFPGIGVVDPAQGIWYLRDAASGDTTSFYYGNPGDVPFMGDWDCDGVDTPGLYRQSDGYVYLRNANTEGIADAAFYFGNPGDVPVAGDFDGDGCDTVSIYRPDEARFFVIDRLGAGDAGLGAAEDSYLFGDVGDQPFAGDFDGDGVDSVGVFRRATGDVHLRDGDGPGAATISFSFGADGDRVLAATRSDGADSVVTHRPGDGTFHAAADARSGAIATTVAYGHDAVIPVGGSFGDLVGGDAPPPDVPPYPAVGSGRRIIYSNADQRIWLIDDDETLVKTHLVSGKQGVPGPGVYDVYSKSLFTWAPYGGISMTHMVRFAHGAKWPYGFHAIPLYADGTPMQTEDELGSFRSSGCVRQRNSDAVFVYEWADVGTTVHVLP